MTEEKEIVEEQIQDQSQEVETAQVEAAIEEPKKDINHNWAQANEVMRLQKQRIDELEARVSQTQKPKEEEQDEFKDLDPEDYLKVSTAKELAKKLAKKEAEITAKRVVQEYAQQQQIVHDEQRMRDKHEDFDYIIENYAIPMIKNDPALAYKIQTSKNPAEIAYKLAKISDEYEANNMKQPVSAKAEKILKNASRPVSSNSVNSSLKTQVDDFSKMDKGQIWEMSQKFAKSA
jgi:hypothetical protein